MNSIGSNLVTLPGLGVLTALLLVAAYFKIAAMEALLVVLLILCATAYLWAKYALSKIKVDLPGQDCYAFPGTVLEAEAEIKNGKFLPLVWLRVSFPTLGCACLAPLGEGDEPSAICADFSWVMPQQSLRFTQKATACARGVCQCRSLTLISGDGFGLTTSSKEETLPAAFRFVVYPEIFPVDVSRILRHMSELEKHNRGLYTDTTLINSVRGYQAGDSIKDINWRLLAREDKVQVNVHQHLSMRRVCFIADLADFTYMEAVQENGVTVNKPRLKKEAFEHMLSLIASLIVRLNEHGVLCSVIIPQIAHRPACLIMPESAEAQVTQLLTALAEVDYGGEKTRFPAEEIMARHHLLGQLFLFSRGLESESGAELLRQMPGFSILRVVQQTENSGEAYDRSIIQERKFILL